MEGLFTKKPFTLSVPPETQQFVGYHVGHERTCADVAQRAIAAAAAQRSTSTFRALGQLFRQAAAAPHPDGLEDLARQIAKIEAAIRDRTEVTLTEPDDHRGDPLTLTQQCCDAIASVYAGAADDSSRAGQVDEFLDVLNGIFYGARDIWKSADAAARYLARPTTQLDGDSPLAAARHSLERAKLALGVIREAGKELDSLERYARKLVSQNPTPTRESVIGLACRNLGSTEGMAFLQQPHPLLEGQTPLALAESGDGEGAVRVDRLLRQALAATAL